MLMTRALYLILFLVNLVLNGHALVHVTGIYAAGSHVVAGALVFNLVLLPVALFAAYRMGGMTEEIYRRKEQAVLGSANQRPAETVPASPSHEAPAKSETPVSPAASKPDGSAGTSRNGSKTS